MFSLLKSVFRYTKIIVVTPEEHDSCEIRKNNDTYLTFLTMKAIHQKQSHGSFL